MMHSNLSSSNANKDGQQTTIADALSLNKLKGSEMPNSEEQQATTSLHDVTAQQAFNEALIKLLVLLYQIDGKVTLTEQDLFDDILAQLDWHSGVSISAFVNDAIHQARLAIDHQRAREFLFSLANGLNHDPARALELAMDITEVDGRRSEDELELLGLLSNRVLAKGFIA